MPGNKPKPLAERFWARVQKTDDCWLWTGRPSGFGYGRIMLPGGEVVMAHRASWLIHFGPIPDGKIVCHRCDTPACIRPDHLFLGTHADNVHDKIQKGRQKGNGWGLRTHCFHGHEYTPENTRITRVGFRRCRVCEKRHWTNGNNKRKIQRVEVAA